MANVYAVKTGNWSDATVWNTGALPTTTDDVYSNTFTVTIDQNVTVLSIRNAAASPIVAGGTFIVSGNYTINCTSGGIIWTTGTLLTYNGTGTCTINSNMSGFGSALSKTGTGTLNISGNMTGTTFLIPSSGQGTVNFVGNISTTGTTCVNITAPNVVFNLTGNINIASNSTGIFWNTGSAGGILNMTGNISVTGGTSNGVYSFAANTTNNIIGNVTVTSSSPGIFSPSNGVIVNITGIITAGPSSVAILLTGITSTLNAQNCILINAQQLPGVSKMAIVAYNMTINPTTSFRWQFYNEAQSSTVNLYAAGFVPDSPVESDVRLGIVYLNGDLTGTLAVPPVESVLLGVPTDNTTGTYATTPAAIAQAVWDELTTDITAAGSIGERLKNAATVSSTAAQIASF
jgi:hypothetical protein